MKSPVLVAALLLPLLIACGGEDEQPAETGGTCEYADSPVAAAKEVTRPSAEPDPESPGEVTISTSRGDIKIALDPDKTPCTVNSFLHLADAGFYDNTQCHRLVTSGIFVLQCGDPTATGSGGPGYRFADEIVENDPRLTGCADQETASGPATVCTYPAGTVAMANSGPDTNGSQFFLVYQDSPLPPDYTVFGRMSAGGLNVVSKVAAEGNAADGVAPTATTLIETIK